MNYIFRVDVEIKAIQEEKEEIRRKKEEAERDRDVQATNAARRNAELQVFRNLNFSVQNNMFRIYALKTPNYVCRSAN